MLRDFPASLRALARAVVLAAAVAIGAAPLAACGVKGPLKPPPAPAAAPASQTPAKPPTEPAAAAPDPQPTERKP